MEEAGADGKQPQSTGDRRGCHSHLSCTYQASSVFLQVGTSFGVSDYFIYFYFLFCQVTGI